ncbi:MAG: hypothetical protein HOW73_26785 [Polyangiaceae bacterium]|nr:hypothetical protein [Polyangiaceae bacterium]
MSAVDGSDGSQAERLAEVGTHRVEVLAATHLIRATTAGLRCRALLEEYDVDAALDEYLAVEDAVRELESLVSCSGTQMRDETVFCIFRARARAKKLGRLLAACR